MTYYVHYWFGPNDDDNRLVLVTENLCDAETKARECPKGETAHICDDYGVEYEIEERN